MIYILLPAYNEELSLKPLFLRLRDFMERNGHSYRIIVCNDGSTDGTAVQLKALAAEYPLEVIEHKINRGLGETSRDLFERAVELAVKGDVLVRMDCDNTHNPEAIGAMLEKLEAGCDVVIASRFQPGGGQMGVSGYRAAISRGANLFMKMFFPIPGLREYSCGFRAYRADVIALAIRIYGNNFIQLKGLGFTCTLEKILKLKLLGARFGEVPFVLRYDNKLSTSKMITSITTLGYIIMTILYYWPFGGWRWEYRVSRLPEVVRPLNSSASTSGKAIR
jgi:dolichol-phosphate mannosyltransferase